jgi:hypothetical protein
MLFTISTWAHFRMGLCKPAKMSTEPYHELQQTHDTTAICYLFNDDIGTPFCAFRSGASLCRRSIGRPWCVITVENCGPPGHPRAAPDKTV